MTEKVSIDESMNPYYRKYSMKQHIRGKPICFEYKQWILATPLRYAIYRSPYQKTTAGYDKTLCLGHSVIIELVCKLPPTLPFHVYVDNVFYKYGALPRFDVKRIWRKKHGQNKQN